MLTSIHYQTLSKKDTTWKISVKNPSVSSFQGFMLLFLNKRDDFVNKNEGSNRQVLIKHLLQEGVRKLEL